MMCRGAAGTAGRCEKMSHNRDLQMAQYFSSAGYKQAVGGNRHDG